MMARQWSNIESYTVVSDICVRERMEELFEEHRPDYLRVSQAERNALSVRKKQRL